MEKKNQGLGSMLLIILVALAAFLGGIYFSKNKNTVSPATGNISSTPTTTAGSTQSTATKTIAGFTVTQDDICLENGKPVVYYFGASSCPHCKWEYPIIQKVAAKFTSSISFHDNMDKNENDRDIWNKYASINQGGIPFIVAGCRYARVGSGETSGVDEEEKNLTALFCKITDSKDKICSEVQDRISQIE